MSMNVTAPINQLGFGICGLNIAMQLERMGHEPALWPIGPVEPREDCLPALQQMRSRTNRYDKYAPSLRVWHPFDLAHHVGCGSQNAFTMFELNRLKPYELAHIQNQDRVFVPTKWAKTILEAEGVDADAVFVAPLGVDHTIFRPVESYPTQGETIFLNVGKWEVRKGHDVLIRAFCEAFEPTDHVQLVMLCDNPCFQSQEEYERYNREWVNLYKNSSMGGRITLLPRLRTQQEVASLMANVDCGVFPARAEGWNLDLAEMLAMGKECIATYCTGHTEFLTPENCRLILVDELEEAHDDVWFLANSPEWEGRPGQWWDVEASINQLVAHLREVHHLKQSQENLFNEAGVRTMEKYRWSRTAQCILDGIDSYAV